MQHPFQAATAHPLKPVSSLDLWLDPVAALYPKFLFEALDDRTVLQPARQRLLEAYGANAIVRMKTPAPERFSLDALHIMPLQVSQVQNCAVILCPGANGYYEDSFTSQFAQVCPSTANPVAPPPAAAPTLHAPAPQLLHRCAVCHSPDSHLPSRSGSGSALAMCTLSPRTTQALIAGFFSAFLPLLNVPRFHLTR
jgi:hypothetical protein